MSERSNVCQRGPSVAIFDSHRELLHESAPTAFGDRSLKSTINTLRTMQRETNEFLTKLVNEQTSQDAGKKESAAEDKDSADEEDDGDEDEDESACPKKRKHQ
ncbi:uncharacterized protein LOC111865887 [Cryptotermes secundus]|uniref:uncharacterized protein LOC111865887 n=1 Tax=Cryptotermes secundus TaxID=105785 RepID=UPI000CD7B1B0|nr:uncharacterized protein LOC111865887 [Cryptotermes secundus]